MNNLTENYRHDLAKMTAERDRWKSAYERANAEVLRLAELLRKADPNWGTPMTLNAASTTAHQQKEK